MKPTACSLADTTRDHRQVATGGGTRGFTLIELLVVVATLALLALTLLPVLAKSRVKPQGTQCLSNLRQIAMGFLMYANENQDYVPISHSGSSDNPLPAGYINWVTGIMTYGDIGNTNSAWLVDPNLSQLAPYVQNPATYRCPADQSTHDINQQGAPRVRSYVMNGLIGCEDLNGDPKSATTIQFHYPPLPPAPTGAAWFVYTKTSQMKGGLSPSGLWVFVCEHPDFNADGVFTETMTTIPAQARWNDIPSKYHGNSGAFSFADGHAELHKWQYPGLMPEVTYNPGILPTTPDRDVLWFYYHSSVPNK